MKPSIAVAADHGGFTLKNELVETFLDARFSGEERFRRRLDKILTIEQRALQGDR